MSEPYLLKKGKKEEDQQARLFSTPLNDSLTALSTNLNKLEEYIIHPREFSTLLHVYGLNMKMVNQMYALIENTFMREIIKTEVAIRSFKMIYRKKMQETFHEGTQSN